MLRIAKGSLFSHVFTPSRFKNLRPPLRKKMTLGNKGSVLAKFKLPRHKIRLCKIREKQEIGQEKNKMIEKAVNISSSINAEREK